MMCFAVVVMLKVVGEANIFTHQLKFLVFSGRCIWDS